MDSGHQCTNICRCPIHGLAWVYSRSKDLHACQIPGCQYDHGYENNTTVVIWRGKTKLPQSMDISDRWDPRDTDFIPYDADPNVNYWG